MTRLHPTHNYAADECIAQIPLHHIPTLEEKVRASESFDKTVLIAAHMAALHDAYILEMATHPVQDISIKPTSPTSILVGLKPSSLKQLKIGKVHRKRVLLGTLCSKTLVSNTPDGILVVNVLEDDEGLATPIYLSHALEENCGSDQAQRFYPQGSKVAIREPYLTRLTHGEVILSVEKPSDFTFLWVPDSIKGKNEGSEVIEFSVQEKMRQPNIGDSVDMCINDDGDGNNADTALLHEKEGATIAKGDTRNKVEQEEEEKAMEIQVASNGTVENKEFENQGRDPESQRTVNVEHEEVAEERTQGINLGHEVAQDGPRKERFDCMSELKGGCDKEETSSGVDGVRASRELNLEDLLQKKKGKDKGEKDEEGHKERKVETTTREDEKQDEESEEELEAEVALNFRAKGNALFAVGHFAGAAEMYRRGAIKARHGREREEEVMCMSNRAEALLRLGHYEDALIEAEAALELMKLGVSGWTELAVSKVLFRKGRALMGLRRYEEAHGVLKEVLAVAPAERQLREAATKCQVRMQRIVKPGKRQRAAALKKKQAGP